LFAELGDKLAQLTIAQAVELKTYLKDKYQIEPAAGAPMMVQGGGQTAGPAAPAAEPTEFNVVLEAGFDAAKKIGIIKVVRELTGQGLAEAKATVEGRPEEHQGRRREEDRRGRQEEAGRGRGQGQRQAGVSPVADAGPALAKKMPGWGGHGRPARLLCCVRQKSTGYSVRRGPSRAGPPATSTGDSTPLEASGDNARGPLASIGCPLPFRPAGRSPDAVAPRTVRRPGPSYPLPGRAGRPAVRTK
jgi:large subunit ribosomal protein L7/L12